MIVAIVGRPNVGKSSLFNALCGEKAAIVKDTPGVTRDRLYREATWLNHHFTVVDTGGIDSESEEGIPAKMREQAEIAIRTADAIIFVVDGKDGLTDADASVAQLLRQSRKRVVLAVNKIDSFKKQEMDIYEFYNLGLGDPVAISAVSKQGMGDLMEAVFQDMDENASEEEDTDIPQIAIIGKPNVGKSSLVNFLSNEERMIVSDIAGTTRDAVDTKVRYQGKDYIFIDTAGLRRKSRIKEDIEEYSIIRAVSAVEKADLVLLVVDASVGVTEQDAKIAGIAHENGKGLIILVNKWDLVEKDDKTIYRFTEDIKKTLSFVPYAQLLFISVKTGKRVDKIYDLMDTVLSNQALRIATGVLNEVITKATVLQQPPSDKGKRLKIFYATEVSVKPPTFVIFVNDKELMHFSYVRYLENQIRDAFGFTGTPLRFLIRERGEE